MKNFSIALQQGVGRHHIHETLSMVNAGNCHIFIEPAECELVFHEAVSDEKWDEITAALAEKGLTVDTPDHLADWDEDKPYPDYEQGITCEAREDETNYRYQDRLFSVTQKASKGGEYDLLIIRIPPKPPYNPEPLPKIED